MADVRAHMRKTWQALAIFGAIFGLAASASQGPELSTVMREKLEHAQKILRGRRDQRLDQSRDA
jgi:hypothetical protein